MTYFDSLLTIIDGARGEDTRKRTVFWVQHTTCPGMIFGDCPRQKGKNAEACMKQSKTDQTRQHYLDCWDEEVNP